MSVISMTDANVAEATLRKTWDELRDALHQGKLKASDTESALQYTFLRVFNDMFAANNEQRYFKKYLEAFDVLNIYRCCRLSSTTSPSYERFMPKSEFITEDNRFSPVGVEWLYLSYGETMIKAKECAKNECRIKIGEIAAFCEFKTSMKNALIADLTIAEEQTYDSINGAVDNLVKNTARRCINQSLSRGGLPTKEEVEKSTRKMAELWVVYTYIKMFTKELFVPVDGDAIEKKNMYAPFQCLAYYFQSLGYDGIAFPSTVYRSGKNLVLFDKSMAEPFGNIEVAEY